MQKKEIKKEIENALATNSETEKVEFKNARGGFPPRQNLSAEDSAG